MRRLGDYLGITLGAIITAVALNMFLIPHKIAAGGTSGLATVLHHSFGWPVGITMLCFETPLFLLSLKILGKRFGFNTLFGAVALSVFIDLIAPYTPVLTNDLMLNALYGGVLSGIGMSLVFKFKATTAGTDIVAAILNKVFRVSIGKALFSADFLVILTAAAVFVSPELCLYACITLFVTTRIIDFVQQGPNSAKAFIIMTDYPEKIAEIILKKMSRGATFLKGRGAYAKKDKEVLFCVIGPREVSVLKELIYNTDKNAFVIVADAHEVLGEGFNSYY